MRHAWATTVLYLDHDALSMTVRYMIPDTLYPIPGLWPKSTRFTLGFYGTLTPRGK